MKKIIIKSLRVLFGLCVPAGIFLAIGTAGGSDFNQLTLHACIVRMLIATFMMSFGVAGLYAINTVAEIQEKYKHARKD